MELSHRTWIAAIKLAVVVSVVAAFAAVVVSSFGAIPDMAIVALVSIIGFAASWVQTGRVRNDIASATRISVPIR